MKKLALVFVIGMFLSFAMSFNNAVKAQDEHDIAAQDSLSIDDMDPVLYHPDDEMEEESGSSNGLLWGGIAVIVVVGGVLIWKKSKK